MNGRLGDGSDEAVPEPSGARVLVVDDSLTIRRGLSLTLKRSKMIGQVLEAQDGQDAIDTLAPGGDRSAGPEVDLVLCDVVMPELDGFAFLEWFRNQPLDEDVPVIMLTGQEAVDKKVRALEAGASDYLTKPFEPAELMARVRVHLKIKRLQDELRDANERLHALSITDGLTGVYNRRHFLEVLERELLRTERHQHPLTVLMLDVDHFKAVNDEHGHLAGDRALVGVADALRANLRRHDTVGRYGGEEFIILLPDTPSEVACGVADKIRQTIQGLSLDEGRVRLTVSLGVACWPEVGSADAQVLIGRADDALYQSKTQGRTRVACWVDAGPRVVAGG